MLLPLWQIRPFCREYQSKKKTPSESGLGRGVRAYVAGGGQIHFESSLVAGMKDSCPLFMLGFMAAQAVVTQVAGLSTTASSPVHLVEEKVFTHFNDEAKKECKCWVLDSGVSNHMTGVQEASAVLNTNIRGTIHFVDGSVVEIVGIVMVLFICKTGEHISLNEVYLIPKLTKKIISLG
jgi:hypothetical protein